MTRPNQNSKIYPPVAHVAVNPTCVTQGGRLEHVGSTQLVTGYWGLPHNEAQFLLSSYQFSSCPELLARQVAKWVNGMFYRTFRRDHTALKMCSDTF